MAKLRAARKLVARVAEACGASHAVDKLHLAATTSERMMARRDPWVNMLRTTVACAGAAFGGADAITVLPFTWALGKPDAFARRIARNTHLVLQEESALGRVIDPAHGAWFIEKLTEDLAKTAWELFQEIEAKGGMGAALESGFIQDEIGRVAEARAARHRHGPLRADRRLRLPAAGRGWRQGRAAPGRRARRQGRHLGCAAASPPAGRALRAAARRGGRASRQDGQAAAGVPGLARRSRRAFGALDVDAQFPRRRRHRGHRRRPSCTTPPTPARPSPTAARTIACICSSDQVYAELAEATAGALKAAGASKVLLAGRPKEQEAALKAAGVDAFIFAGCDAVATLARLQEALGVKA